MFQYEIPPNFMEMFVTLTFIFLAFTKDKKFIKKSGLPNEDDVLYWSARYYKIR